MRFRPYSLGRRKYILLNSIPDLRFVVRYGLAVFLLFIILSPKLNESDMMVKKSLMGLACLAGLAMPCGLGAYCAAPEKEEAAAVHSPEPEDEAAFTIDEKKPIDEAVVTGTRNATDIRHLPFTVTVIDRQQIERPTRCHCCLYCRSRCPVCSSHRGR